MGIRRVTPITAALLVLGSLTAAPAAAQEPDPCHDPTDPAYGSHDCKVVRLREQPWVVIATVDSGINPYQEDFRLPPNHDLQGVHPSEFIEGYPADTKALDLSLSAPSLEAALAQDQSEWQAIEAEEPLGSPGRTSSPAGTRVRVASSMPTADTARGSHPWPGAASTGRAVTTCCWWRSKAVTTAGSGPRISPGST